LTNTIVDLKLEQNTVLHPSKTQIVLPSFHLPTNQIVTTPPYALVQ